MQSRNDSFKNNPRWGDLPLKSTQEEILTNSFIKFGLFSRNELA